jgi:hypothetical protein
MATSWRCDMKKIFDYPAEGWPAESKWHAAKLALEIYKRATEKEICARLLSPSNPYVVGHNKAIQSPGFNMQLRNEDYGCHLGVYVFDETEDVLRFLILWKSLVDEDIVFGGPYRKGTKVDLAGFKKAKVKDQVREIVCEVMKTEGWSPNDIRTLYTLGDIALASPKDYDEVMNVLERAYGNHKDRPGGVLLEDCRLSDFMRSDHTLYNWEKLQKE